MVEDFVKPGVSINLNCLLNIDKHSISKGLMCGEKNLAVFSQSKSTDKLSSRVFNNLLKKYLKRFGDLKKITYLCKTIGNDKVL